MEDGLREDGAELKLAEAALGNIAFLRHRVAGLEHRSGSDWDIAVRDEQGVGWIVESLFGKPLISVPKQFVVQRYFEWGQIDLLPCFEWQGITYLSPDRFWSRVSVHEDGLPRPCISHDAFIVWMTGLLWGGRYSDRYDELILRALDEEEKEFSECLMEAFGGRLGRKMLSYAESGKAGSAVSLVGHMRTTLWMRSIGRGNSTISRQVSHWGIEVRHHIRTPFPWIAVLGPDGSGKSTMIEGLKERLARSRISIVQTHWWPEPRKPGEVSGPPVVDPHGQKPRGFLLSVAKTVWLWVRWWRARLGPVGHVLSKRSMLISDRYFDDLAVDPKRYRFGGPMCFAKLLFRFAPRPDRVVILVGDAKEIHARKQEVSMNELKRQLVQYRELAEKLGGRAQLVDSSRAVDQVQRDFWAAVFPGADKGPN